MMITELALLLTQLHVRRAVQKSRLAAKGSCPGFGKKGVGGRPGCWCRPSSYQARECRWVMVTELALGGPDGAETCRRQGQPLAKEQT